MFLRLLAAFILIPLVELYLLLQLASLTNAGTTFLLVIVTGIIGTMLAKREGVMAWHKFQQALAEGRAPSKEIQDGLMIVFAAALLLTPGLLTDAVGFMLLFPPGRAFVRKFILGKYLQGMKVKFTSVDMRSRDSSSVDRPRKNPVTIDATSVQHRKPSA
ncbi:FxsA family protein [Stieleria varia]|uniref:Phage T7 F exclusion suppressor FxsA n=1 Tax=Stieleria varia TaxID=2528005 RepID=A0A5C6B9J5_9BACT|nr:FxsA family protein [Stieleria varia]TWU07989.1 phage T7 F exclusion suppressor FxsA [Stieleria varia]